MTEELEKCPFCYKSDMLREMDECDDILVDCQRCEASAWKDIWQRRAQPKYKRVDLDEIKKKMSTGSVAFKQNETNAIFTNAIDNVYNRALDDIKSKFGDLYVEVSDG